MGPKLKVMGIQDGVNDMHGGYRERMVIIEMGMKGVLGMGVREMTRFACSHERGWMNLRSFGQPCMGGNR